MAKVIKTDADGRIVISGGRAQMAEGLEAKAQLLAERLQLRRGDDRLRPLRGVDWDALQAARATPRTAALAAGAELQKDPLVVSATFEAREEGDGYLLRSEQSGEPWRVWALEGSVVCDGEQTAAEIAVEVPLG